jgi:secreted trypsin-like serine protease
MSSRVRVALFAVAAGTCLGALSCSPAEPTAGPRLGRAHGAIQGGKTDSTHTFAVAVDSDGGTCSGTLIAPNLVLTARHCISFSGGEEVDCSTDEFGRVYSASRFRVTTDAVVTSGATFHAVASILTPPAKEFCGNDIALLLLGDNVAPEEAQPAAPVVDSMTDHSRYGTQVTAIGYGITSPSADDDGTRRTREKIPMECVPGDPQVGCKPLSEYDMTETEFIVREGGCTGDSGSSAFDPATLDSTPVTFGVLSRAGETSTNCVDVIYTRTDAFKDFLIDGATRAAEEGGYPRPLWAGGPEVEADAGTDSAASPAPAAPVTASPRGGGGCAVTRVESVERRRVLGANIGWLGLGVGVLALRRRRQKPVSVRR